MAEPVPAPDPGLEPAVETVPESAAPAAAAAAVPRQMSSDEITKALGDLADLRDRNAITPEEYEAKKAELLGRL